MKLFGDCLKLARRNAYLANGGYNVLIVCANSAQLYVAFAEARRILEGSSLAVERVNTPERKIYCDRGATFWFRVSDANFDQILTGYEWPHIITLCAVGNRTEDLLQAFNRTSNPNITPVFEHGCI